MQRREEPKDEGLLSVLYNSSDYVVGISNP
jgi:hypothetical protein